MKNIKLMLHDDKFASLSSSEVVFSGEDNEFFYEDTNEAVPYGEPIGLDMPIYDFEHLQYQDNIKDSDDSRDAEKWRYNADQEFEALINDWISPREIKLVLFKNIYWNPSNKK